MKVDPIQYAKDEFNKALDKFAKVTRAKILDPRIYAPMREVFQQILKTGFVGGEFIGLVGKFIPLVEQAEKYVSPVQKRTHDNHFLKSTVGLIVIAVRRSGLSDDFLNNASARTKSVINNDNLRDLINNLAYRYEAARKELERVHAIPDQAAEIVLRPKITLPTLLPRVPHTVNNVGQQASMVISSGDRQPTPTKKKNRSLLPLLAAASLLFLG